MLGSPLARQSDRRADPAVLAALADGPVADDPQPIAPEPVVTLANLDDYDPSMVLHCGYPSEEDGTRCDQLSRYFVQRMPTDYAGPHKFVHVCRHHAKRWRRAIPYCYIVEIRTGVVYPGQRFTNDYQRSYAQPCGYDLDSVPHA